WWAVEDGELTVSESSGEITHDLRLVPAGVVVVWVLGSRLPVAGARLDAIDTQGTVVRSETDLGRHETNVIVPAGEYTLRLRVPGAPEQERRLMLEPGIEAIQHCTFVVP